jgi:hypothetical protein
MSQRMVPALVSGLGLLAGAGLVGWALWLPSASVPVEPTPTAVLEPTATATVPNRDELLRQARERARTLLDQADQEGRQAVADQIRTIDAFFDDARARTPALAEVVLGFTSEWRLAVDQIPYAGGGRHAAFLRQEFDRQLFTPEELDQRVQAAVRGYLQSEHEIEDRLLVRLHQDLDDIPAALPDAGLDLDAVRVILDRAMAEATVRVQAGLQLDVAREIVVLASAEILTRLAVRTALPASLAGSGPWTFGLGLAAAVAADQALAWTWDRWTDPRGQLVERLDASLDELRHRVVDGTPEGPGLRQQLEGLARERAARRRAVVLKTVAASGGEP